MSELKNDCFAGPDKMLEMDKALDLLFPLFEPRGVPEMLPLTEALGRVLAEDIISTICIPPHNNSAVDGYAVRFDELTPESVSTFPISARVAAGNYHDEEIPAGTAVRILTGAPVPDGFETIFMQEDCQVEGDQVTLPAGMKKGANSRKKGEDINTGDQVFSKGQVLRPQDIGLLAALGQHEISVYPKLSIAIFSTGDEIQNPDTTLESGHIYDINRFSLMGMMQKYGFTYTDLGILPDDPKIVETKLQKASETHDVIFTSGGVSVGEEDHVKQVIESLGEMHFWKMAIKPGRPIAVGQIGHARFICLPGNPVATLMTFLLIAKPLLFSMAGACKKEPPYVQVMVDFDMKKKVGRREFLRVNLFTDENGTLKVKSPQYQGSGVMRSMVECDGIVDLPEDCPGVEKGDFVKFIPFESLI